MNISDFQTWKRQGCPFRRGAEIYEKEGDSGALKKLFALGESSYSKDKLYTALEGLAYESEDRSQETEVRRVKMEDIEAVNDMVKQADKLPVKSDLKSVITDIDAKLIKLYKDQSNCHSQMKLKRKKETRGAMAEQIIEIGHEIRRLIAKKKYIEKNNALPPEVKELQIEDITDRANLFKKQLNNRVYITKYRSRKDKADEVAKRTRENEEITKILNS